MTKVKQVKITEGKLIVSNKWKLYIQILNIICGINWWDKIFLTILLFIKKCASMKLKLLYATWPN